MVSWLSPEEIAKDKTAYVNILFAFFGLYVWEVFQTSDFEWAILQRRRKLRWHWVIFLFICRYCLIFSLAALMASFTVKKPINCHALFTFISWAGNMSLLCASTTLMFRTIALWERKLTIVIPLAFLCLAHWALLWRGMFIISAEYDAASAACIVTATKRLFLSITFWATMGFNLVLTVVHVIGLMQRDHGATFWQMLFEDGLIFYLVAFSCNALPAILSVVNLNSIMNVIASVPAAVLTTMAACRSVTRLSEIGEDDDLYVHSVTHLSPPRPLPSTAVRLQTLKRGSRYPTRPEVHVTTDHIVMEDYEGLTCGNCSLPRISPGSRYTPHDKPPELTDDKGESDRAYNAV
ncbi:hypothetical protein BD414DRAFT_452439 [Trametes punicea]|nr:hypothetical protein BD414DRAFT_452439 [Trametes punicea]